MNMVKTSVLLLEALLVSVGIAGETLQGDITAAVRAAGQSVGVVSSQGNAAGTPNDLTNGKWKNERYLSSEATGPLSLDFTVGSAFLPGEDVVVTGLVFTVGGNGSNLWGDSAKRMPKAFTVSGSNDGGVTWTTIVSVGSFTDYATSGHATELHTHSGTVSFANWTSYRKYRIAITEATGSSNYFIQLSEVALLGHYGGTVVQPEPVFADLTAGARAARAQTLVSNAGDAGSSYAIEKLTDGLYGYNSNRYLTNMETTKELWDAGSPVTIDYTFGETYARGADVVVTAYTIDVDQAHGYSFNRLPKDWELQGWDGTAWQTIDRMVGFTDWQTVMHANEADGQEHPHWSYTFSIANSVSYRKYRLSVTKTYDRSKSNGDYFQLTELQLWGYADAGIAGKVGLVAEPRDLHITEEAFKGAFTPVLTISAYDQTENLHAGTVDCLFDRNFASRLLARMGVDGDEKAYLPLTIGYEIPQTYLTGKDIVLKRYSLFSRTDAGQYDKRVPKSWTLQGLADDGRWIKLDRRNGFTDWKVDGVRYFATFELAGNCLAFRSYRLVISDVAGTSDFSGHTGMQQILLYEIELDGQWGMNIGGPLPRPSGLTVVFR